MKRIFWLLSQKKMWFMALAAVLLLMAAAPASQAAAQPQGTYHHVRWGETLSEIAHRYGVPMHAVLRANPQITNPDRIYAGTRIYIPARMGQCRFHHYVTRGQTLSQISRQYNVPIHMLMSANGLQNPDLIYAGSRLCIP